MSKYNHYAHNLDKAFRSARENYCEGFNRFEGSREALARAKTANSDKVTIAGLEYAFEKESQAFRDNDAWQGLDKEIQKLSDSLKAELDADTAVNPDDVDLQGVAVLEMISNDLSATDFKRLLNHYSDNVTMRRMITSAAKTKLQQVGDVKQRQELQLLVHDGESATQGILNDWNALVHAAETMSGASSPHDPEFRISMSRKWEDVVSKQIEDF